MASTAAAAERTPRTCFDTAQVRDWTSDGDRVVFLQVRTSEYYRVDLASSIPQLRSFSGPLVVSSNSDRVCNAGDLGLTLSLSPTLRLPLGATRVTRLSADEIAAIGSENLPGRRHRGQ
jgi:hypothetical protein